MELSALFKTLRAAKGFTQHKVASELNNFPTGVFQKRKKSRPPYFAGNEEDYRTLQNRFARSAFGRYK